MVKVDTDQTGIQILYPIPYKAFILETLLEDDVDWQSREMCDLCIKKGYRVSRASVINHLNELAEIGWVKKDTTYGKGGERGVYSRNYTREMVFKKVLTEVHQKITEAVTGGPTEITVVEE